MPNNCFLIDFEDEFLEELDFGDDYIDDYADNSERKNADWSKEGIALKKLNREKEIVRLHDEEKLSFSKIAKAFHDRNNNYENDEFYNVDIGKYRIWQIYKEAKRKEKNV